MVTLWWPRGANHWAAHRGLLPLRSNSRPSQGVRIARFLFFLSGMSCVFPCNIPPSANLLFLRFQSSVSSFQSNPCICLSQPELAAEAKYYLDTGEHGVSICGDDQPGAWPTLT
ncbi:hypothetical protein EXIGLDRAFT_320578 [Exidia glandulosa HHB12029]|uniref:Uncharacterized protein n=1 Tax=Exidia glandulosa HHB12029 TaxID=1314781 RepID=A0A165Q5F9_EXIGL|nr:hypothetical protein EXIGLDRAFT_320578 [Exidia glandulosa HHB12029]